MTLASTVTLEQLDRDPHPVLAKLLAQEPVAWIDALGGWLVTRHDLALEAMREADRFTVDDARFSTARVIGQSMLSLDGESHRRHREPFVAPFRPRQVRERFAGETARHAERLIDGFAPAGAAELRSAFAGPLAATIVTRALGLGASEAGAVLEWYRSIVASVTAITAGEDPTTQGGRAFGQLRGRLTEVISSRDLGSLLGTVADQSDLTDDQIASNAAVLLFGGIETTEGMIANALLDVLSRPGVREAVSQDETLLDRAIEESLRLEPAAAVIDRYATSDTSLGGAAIRARDLVRISIAAANRDPAVFDDPDRFELSRPNARRHLAFAQGPHVCVGVHLARLEARIGIGRLLSRLPAMSLDRSRPAEVTGLVFRKPQSLHARWRPAG